MTYWKNRIEQEIKARQKAEYSLDVRMQNMYDHYIREIEKEINDFYTRYAVRESISVSEAKKRVSEMDVQAFSDKAKRYVKEKNFSDEANKELALYNLKMKISRLQLLQYNIDLQLLGLSDEETKLAEEYLNQEYKQEIKSQAGIMSEFVNNPKEVKTSMSEILAIPFHGVTWKTGLREQQDAIRQVVAKATEDLLIKGKNPTTYISKLTKDMKIKRYEAKRLLVTEGARLQTEVQKATYLENDFEEYEFMAESTACKICSALDGKIFKVEDMEPGENACPMHPHCHCSTAPHLDRKKALEKAKRIRNVGRDRVTESKPVLYRPKLEKLKENDNSKATNIKIDTATKKVVMNTEIKTLKAFVENSEKWYNNNIKGVIPDEDIKLVSDKIKEVIDNSSYAMRFHSRNIDSLLNSQKFMNIMETGTSSGSLIPKHRRIASQKLFGTPQRGVKKSEYEKYGYIAHKDPYEDWKYNNKKYGGVNMYGDVIIHFHKDKIADRVTYTMDDSLGLAVKGHLVADNPNYPKLVGMSTEYNKHKDFIKMIKNEDIKNSNELSDKLMIRYVEAQYHGDITLKDVDKMYFTGKKPTKEQITKLRAQGVKLYEKREDVFVEIK